MTAFQQVLSSISDMALPLGSALLAAGIVIKCVATSKSELRNTLYDLRKVIAEQKLKLEVLIEDQQQLASKAQVDEALRNQQSRTIDALLLAGQAFVEKQRTVSDISKSAGVDRDR